MKVFKTVIIAILFLSANFANAQNLENLNWEMVKTQNLPQARHESCFVEVDGKFYLLGSRRIKPVNIFDPETLIWTESKLPPIEIHHSQAVAYKNKIYIFYAMTGKYPHETPIENIFIYDTQTNTWQKGDEIPKARRRGSAGVVVDGDKAIIASGIIDGHSSGFVKWTDSYIFKTGEWKILADAPRPRDHYSAALHEGKIYCVGGRNSSNATNQTFDLTIAEVDVYDIKTDTWLTLPQTANTPTQRAGTSTAFIDNNLLIIGGESVNSDLAAHNEVQALNIKTNKWISLATLNVGRHGTQVIKYKNALYIVAGSGKKGGAPELSSMEKLVFK